MRIDEASKLMGVPTTLIAEIINEENIEVERYLNGNHDLDFDAMIRVYSVYQGSHKIRGSHKKNPTDWRTRVKVLSTKVKRHEIKIEKLKEKLARREKPMRVANKEAWYPRKHRKREQVQMQTLQ